MFYMLESYLILPDVKEYENHLFQII